MPLLSRQIIGCLVWLLLMKFNAVSLAQTSSDTTFLKEGIYFLTIQPGKPAKSGAKAYWIRYRTMLPSGEEIDASEDEGILVRLEDEGYIQGWYTLLPALNKSSKVKAFIPAPQAYHSEGQRDPRNYEQFIVPPNTDLWFEIEVLNIK